MTEPRPLSEEEEKAIRFRCSSEEKMRRDRVMLGNFAVGPMFRDLNRLLEALDIARTERDKAIKDAEAARMGMTINGHVGSRYKEAYEESQREPCRQCNGARWVSFWIFWLRVCPRCNGRGQEP